MLMRVSKSLLAVLAAAVLLAPATWAEAAEEQQPQDATPPLLSLKPSLPLKPDSRTFFSFLLTPSPSPYPSPSLRRRGLLQSKNADNDRDNDKNNGGQEQQQLQRLDSGVSGVSSSSEDPTPPARRRRNRRTGIQPGALGKSDSPAFGCARRVREKERERERERESRGFSFFFKALTFFRPPSTNFSQTNRPVGAATSAPPGPTSLRAPLRRSGEEGGFEQGRQKFPIFSFFFFFSFGFFRERDRK